MISFAKPPSDNSVVWWHKAVVTKIVDGDTIYVTLDRSFKDYGERKIRFAYIDCPDKDRAAKKAATEHLEALVSVGESVLLYSHKSDTGMYGRIIADVIARGVNLNRAQLESGHAKLYGGERW